MGFTQEGFAATFGVEFSTVGRWERGELTPAPHRRARIAAALRVGLEELDEQFDLVGEGGRVGGREEPRRVPRRRRHQDRRLG